MTTNAESIAAYAGTKERITGLVSALDEAATATVAPAAPDWQVRDVVAHVVGITADLVAGNIEGAGSDPWTKIQVEERRDRSVADLLAEWDENWPAFTAVMDGLDEARAAQAVFDVTTHEHDVRGALDAAGARDSDGVTVGWEWATNILGQIRDGYGAGALVLKTEHGEVTAGSSEPTSAVSAERFELWRAMTGRRSTEQVLGFDWEGEPAAEHLCLLPARATPLVE